MFLQFSGNSLLLVYLFVSTIGFVPDARIQAGRMKTKFENLVKLKSLRKEMANLKLTKI